jgi:hypothetical protein
MKKWELKMSKQNGFTLIEWFIAAITVGVVAAFVVLGASSRHGFDGFDAEYSYGLNGLTETRCINGLKFVVSQSGSVQQILGPNGGGVTCQ